MRQRKKRRHLSKEVGKRLINEAKAKVEAKVEEKSKAIEQEEARRLEVEEEKKKKVEVDVDAQRKMIEEEQRKEEEDKWDVDTNRGTNGKSTYPKRFSMMSSTRLFIEGDMPIPMPTNEIVNLEMFSFNRKKKQIVRQTHKKRKLIVDQELGNHYRNHYVRHQRSRSCGS
jgi:hypothetical protein